jgi:hypothetical protein
MTVIYGAAAVAILWWFLSSFTNANAATVAKVVRVAGGVLLLGSAGLLGLRGRFDIAVLLGGAGLWLLGWSALSIPGFGATSQRTSGSTSRVRSALIEMELDHDTGEMDGSVLAGPLAGRRLASFDEAACTRSWRNAAWAIPTGFVSWRPTWTAGFRSGAARLMQVSRRSLTTGRDRER